MLGVFSAAARAAASLALRSTAGSIPAAWAPCAWDSATLSLCRCSRRLSRNAWTGNESEKGPVLTITVGGRDPSLRSEWHVRLCFTKPLLLANGFWQTMTPEDFQVGHLSKEVLSIMKRDSFSRREFMRWGAGAAAAGLAAKVTLLEPQRLWAAAGPVPPSDTVRFGIIGTGTEGCDLLRASLSVPGIECVAG